MISQNKLLSHTDNNINIIHNTNSLMHKLFLFLFFKTFSPSLLAHTKLLSFLFLYFFLSFARTQVLFLRLCSLSFEREKENIHSFVIRHCDNNKINNAYAFVTNIFYNISHMYHANILLMVKINQKKTWNLKYERLVIRIKDRFSLSTIFIYKHLRWFYKKFNSLKSW